MKKTITIFTILMAVFGGAIFIAYEIKEHFKPSCYEKIDLDPIVFNTQFVAKEYVEVKDLGKSFMTILIAVFCRIHNLL